MISGNLGCERCANQTGVCLECSDTSFLLGDDGFCRKKCLENEFWTNTTDNGCRACSGVKNNINCLSCLDSTGECSECAPNFFLNSEKFCQKNCEFDEFWTGSGANFCFKCSHFIPFCELCANKTGECTQCKRGRILVDNACLRRCDRFYEFYDPKLESCRPCGASCIKCQNFTGQCLECLNGFEFTFEGFDCINKTNLEAQKAGIEAKNGKNGSEVGNGNGLNNGNFGGSGGSSGINGGIFDGNTPVYRGPIKLLASYFDRGDFSIRLIFNQEIKAGRLERLRVYLVEQQTVLIQASGMEIRAVPPTIVLRLKFPKRVIKRAKITLNDTASITETQGDNQRPQNLQKSQKSQNFQKSAEIENLRFSVSSAGNSSNQASPLPLTITDIDYDADSSTSLACFASAVLTILLLIISLASALTSAPMAFLLINQTQMVYLLAFIDLRLPRNFLVFQKSFRTNILSFVANPLFRAEPVLTCQLHRQLYIAKKSCLFLNNTGSTVFAVLSVFSAKLIAWGICRVSEAAKGDKGVRETTMEPKVASDDVLGGVRRLDRLINSKFAVFLLLSALIDLMTGALISLRYTEVGRTITTSTGASSVVLLTYSALVLFLLFSSCSDCFAKMTDKSSMGVEGWVVYADIKSRRKISSLVMPLEAIFGVVAPTAVLGFRDNPGLVVSILITIYLVLTLAHSILRPYDSILVNICYITNSVFYLISLFFVLSLTSAGAFSRSESRLDLVVGLPLVGLLSISILVNLAISGFLVYKEVKRLLEERKKAKKRVKEIPDEAQGLGIRAGDAQAGMRKSMVQMPKGAALKHRVTHRFVDSGFENNLGKK